MRKLLNTLYVTTPDTYLALDGENVVVLGDEDSPSRQFPLHILEGIVSFGYKGASPALMGACVERGIALTFFSPNGRYLAGVNGKSRGNILLRKAQYRVSDDPSGSALIAQSFLVGKVYNSRWVLERALRDHRMRVDEAALEAASQALAASLTPIANCGDLEQLRGLEGEAATRYFSVFDELILQNKDAFSFQGRNRRPPLDNINALLSFTYTLLSSDCAAALEGVGLDAYVGFLHRDRPGRASLALDLMEELRSVCADRFVLSLINNRVVSPKGFTKRESGAVVMDDDTRKAVLTAWQNRKKEELTHPFLEEKIPWGLVPFVQAMLLARHLRGDLDAYPPFLWK